MKKIFIAILVLISSAVYSQYELQWYATYDNPHPSYIDYAVDLVEDNSGNTYVTGISFQIGVAEDWRYDYATIKYNTNGDSLWVRRYNSNGEDIAEEIGIDGQNNIYITGSSYVRNRSEITTIKYDAEGNLLWGRSYYDSIYNPQLMVNDMLVDVTGNVYLVCTYHGYSDISEIIKYNANGEIVWIGKYFRRPDDVNVLHSLDVDNYGNVYATGYTIDSASNNVDLLIVKLNTNGSLEWVVRKDLTNEDIGYTVKTDNYGNVYIAGYSRLDNYNHDMKLLKYNSSGEQQWIKSYQGINDGTAFYFYEKKKMLLPDNTGNVYLNFMVHSNGIYNNNDIATAKFNSSGDLLWINKYNCNNGEFPSFEETKDMKIDRSNNIYVTGISRFDTTGNSFVILKYDSAGVLKNIVRNKDQFRNNFIPLSLSVKDNGDITSTGATIVSSIGWEITDYLTVKYSNTTGLNTLSNSIPDKFRLDQNYPNPFNPATSITYSLGEPGLVSLKIFDILGKEISSLVNEKQNAGSHVVEFKGEGLPSGIYFYSLESGKFSATKRMILLK